MNENESSRTQTMHEGGQTNLNLILDEQNLARLIAQQIQLFVAPFAAKANKLSNEITKN